MTFTPRLPVAGRRRTANAVRTGRAVTLEELYQARQTAAECAVMDEIYLPIFERIEREIEAREEKMRSLSRAQQALQKSLYIDNQ